MPWQIIDLNGDQWRIGRAPASAQPGRATWSELEEVDEWLPSTVPGNVRADLARAGRLPDLTVGTQFEASRWVDDHCWWFVRDWALDLKPNQRVHLVLRGVDYIGDLFLNGQWLGRHEGMFSSQVHDITELARQDNLLGVRILGSSFLPSGRSTAWEKLLNRLEARLGGMPGMFPDRRDTLKCQMSFGWDFAPPLRAMGIWDDVYARVSGSAWLRGIVTRSEIGSTRASLLAEVEIDAAVEQPYRLEGLLEPETFAGGTLRIEQELHLQPGIRRVRLRWDVPEPRLWWPWDHGHPDLYRLSLHLLDGEGQLVDRTSHLVGLRRIERDGWTLQVNGRPIYARGANWVPADFLPGRITQDDYEALLRLAQKANMNLLRVWGGGLREKQAFYDLCDRMGILLWQELPFACAFLTRFPRSLDYLALVEREVRAIVRDLREHPSLALWCGGNEFSQGRNRPLAAMLARAVEDEDPSRPFLPASPHGGDSHYWQVWHNYRPPSAYLADDASFASEFGLQAPPDVQALRRFLPPDELWPPGPSWLAHGAGLGKLARYAQPFLEAEPPTSPVSGAETERGTSGASLAGLEAFVQASQRAQAYGLQTAIEHYRRRKAKGCGGALVWQLNEPWPAVSWALLDVHRQPKDAFGAVQRAFQPLLASLEYPLRRYRAGDEIPLRIWLIQDGERALPDCTLTVTLWDEAGQPLQVYRQQVDVVPHSAQPVGQISWILPPGSSWHLTCQLDNGSEILTSNDYRLGTHDDLPPTWRQRLRAWLTGLFIPS
ncbi:MAG: glycoside hydrolase family 2 protein [Anaerolineae bacterium]